MVVLKELDLVSNELTSLPANFRQGMGNLKTLCLNFNKLSHDALSIISRMGSMQSLDLSFNKLTLLPADFGQDMVNLQELKLTGNNLNQKAKEQVAKLRGGIKVTYRG
ncbi:leucine-rich repeat domain-containing protein [Candidatus Babeliales bacterium]|nr:leucine-rich repeat domain-containing protein [Candidatus Babeliales bacterium]